ncbi:hypothetical protein BT96DRAFT_943079 [Gymnopus androsaceus JB14]|uniref:Uncharacterized protein n=1 Tax=Gymnopus androsaceus JB14 TaxID=1447944 RepID=A0A6A4H8E7_9AGAR|nr:hypothetical protein BT96DRAFT_943079 [Gymnopus androsaceus JB14]
MTKSDKRDPVLTLVKCKGHAFLAVIQLGTIKYNSQPTLSLPVTVLHEPNIEVNGQIMSLKMIDGNHQPLRPDWEWGGQLEVPHRAMLRGLLGHMIEPINPELGRPSQDPAASKTYVFHTSGLWGITAILEERLRQDFADGKVPNVSKSETFPYCNLADEACFYCDELETTFTSSQGFCCPCCPLIRIDSEYIPDQACKGHLGN